MAITQKLKLGAVTLSALAIGATNLSATPITINAVNTGIFSVADTGTLVGVTSNPTACISFAGLSTCGSTATAMSVSSADPQFGTTGTIKDIATSFPIIDWKTANLVVGGPAMFDLTSVQTPSGFSACTFFTNSGSCSTGTFVFTQSGSGALAQVGITFTTNEIGYTGSSSTSTPYIGIFTTQLSGGLTQFGCTVSANQACQDTIGDILIFEASAAQTNAVTTPIALGTIGQSGTIKSTWSGTESPISGTPEPVSLVLFGSGLIGLAVVGRRFRRV